MGLIATACLLSSVLAGCHKEIGANKGSGGRTELVKRERSIKERAWDDLSRQPAIALRSELRLFADQSVPAPVGMVPETASSAVVLENNLGHLYRLKDDSTAAPRLEQIALTAALGYPTRLKVFNQKFYVATGSQILKGDSSGSFMASTHTFRAVYDFAPSDDGRIIINPLFSISSNGPHPLVIELDGSGKELRSWGEQDDILKTAGLSGNAMVTACGSSIAVAMVHKPILYLLDRNLTLRKTVDLHLPYAADLASLGSDANLVHPTPHFYNLPGVMSGLACDANSVYVLLDYPALSIYRLNWNGTVVDSYREQAMDPGRRYESLSHARFGDKDKFYTIAVDTISGSRHMVIMTN